MLQKSLGMLIVLVATVYLLTSTTAHSQTGHGPQTWRHMALTSTDQSDPQLAEQINQLGSKGWELVDVENFVEEGKTVKTVYFFKRPE